MRQTPAGINTYRSLENKVHFPLCNLNTITYPLDAKMLGHVNM